MHCAVFQLDSFPINVHISLFAELPLPKKQYSYWESGLSPPLPLLVMFSVTFHTFYLTAGALTWKLHHNFNWLPVRLAWQGAWWGLDALCYLLASLLDDRGQHELGRLIVHDDVAIIDIGRDGVLVLLLV